MPIRFTRPDFSASFQCDIHFQFRYRPKDPQQSPQSRALESPLGDSSSSTQEGDLSAIHGAYNPGSILAQ